MAKSTMLNSLSWVLKCFGMLMGIILVFTGIVFCVGAVLPKSHIDNKIFLALTSLSLMTFGISTFIPNRVILRNKVYMAFYFSVLLVPWLTLPIIGSVICGSQALFSLSCNETMLELLVLMLASLSAPLSVVLDIIFKHSPERGRNS